MRPIAHLQGGARLLTPRRPTLSPLTPFTSQLHRRQPARGIVTEILSANVTAAHELLLFVHAHSHLPWALSIPLTAIVVRCTVALPLQIWSLRQRDMMLHLRPILNAKLWFRRKALLDAPTASKRVMLPQEINHMLRRDAHRDTQAVYRRLRVHRFASWAPLAQMPIWLAVMESLRRMVGAEGGILSILHRLVSPFGKEFDVPLEPSMALEGALWFPNLLVADPHLALPFILSGVMFVNITWGWRVVTNEELAKLPRGAALKARTFRGLKKGLQLVALSLGPTTLASGIPSGLLLYWITSTTFATLQTRAFAKYWPPPEVPKQCANYGVAPAASSDALAQWQIIPKVPEAESVPTAVESERAAKAARAKRQARRYIKQ